MNTNLVGSYSITYTAIDPSGNSNSVTRTVYVDDTTSPVINLVGASVVTNECHTFYTDAGFTAVDSCSASLTYTTNNTVNTNAVGSYSITYTAIDPSGNSNSVTRTVVVRDTTPPVINLAGASVVTNECHTFYTDAGFTASDSCSASLSYATNSTVNTNLVGSYSITYTAIDPSGNSNSVTRTVVVHDTTPPVINLIGASVVTNECHTIYTDAGFTASDSCSASLTYTTNSTVNTNAVGSYSITYTAIDPSGNSNSVTRTVVVHDTTPPVITCPGNMVVAVAAGQCGTNVNFTVNAADTCGAAMVTSSPTNGAFFPVGTTHVTSVAVDGSGNTATCGFDVTVVLGYATNISVNYTVPDDSPLGVVSTMNITTPIGSITNVKVTLNITNGYNGDLYAYLVHQSGFAILLNRVGKTVSNPFGYGDPGFNVTLDDAAANGDVHDYRVTLFGNAVTPIGGPLTGAWAPDGRNVNPLTVLDTDPRTAFLGSFQGLDPNGQWTLFVADLSAGDVSKLVSWGLEIQGSYAAPAITVQPQDASVECGTNASFNVAATGTAPLGYQWYFGTNAIANATNTTLTLVSVHPGDSGGYSVVITNGYCANASAVTSRVAMLNVTDTTPPVVALIGPPVVTNECHTFYTDAGFTAVDSCSASLTYTTNSTVNANVVGSYSITYTAIDPSGNSNSVTRTVVVHDTTPPVINLVGASVVTNECHTFYTDAGFIASDSCSASLTYTTNSTVNTNAVGSYSIIYTAIDPSGNSNSVTRTVVVQDTTPPVITCPGNLMVWVAAGQCGANVNFTVNASDTCGTAIVTSSPTNGSFFPVGTTHVTSVAVDGSGNTATCGFNVTVLLQATNTAVVNYTVPDGSLVGIVSSMNITTPIGSITNVKVTLNITNGYNGDLYAYLVHQSGFAILLNRVGKTVSNPFGYGDPGFNVTLDDAAANGDVHDYRVTLFGNAVTPIGGPLTGVWAPDGRNVNPLTVLDTDPRTALLGSFQGLDPNGQWTLFVADLSAGNTSTLVSWGLEIQGGYAAPAITVQPQDETVQCSQGASFGVTATGTAPLGYQWYFGTNGIANATNATLTLALAHLGNAGGYSVVITNGYCAGAGSVTSRVAVLTVQDTNPPVIVCSTNLVLVADAGQCGKSNVTWVVTASDTCDTPVVVQTAGLTNGATYPTGITTNSFVAIDANSNTATCSFTVTVLDTQPPTIVAPGNLTDVTTDPNECYATGVSLGLPVTGDNCGVLAVSNNAPAQFPHGLTTVTWTVWDTSGNSATATQQVTVRDHQSPVVTVPGNIVTTNDPGLCSAVVVYNVSASDNCGVSNLVQVAGLTNGSAFPHGVTTNVFVATDTSGNAATNSFTVTVNDTQPPTLTVPTNMVVSTDPNLCSAVVSYSVSANDNCGVSNLVQVAGVASGGAFPHGVTTNVFVATDTSGNSVTNRFTVTVNDTQAPTLTVPTNLVVSTDPNLCSAVVVYNVSSNDNCAVASVVETAGLPSGSAFPHGVTTNVFVATDTTGNSVTNRFTVTVNDTQPPVITCPGNMLVAVAAGQCGTNVNFTVNATDNCGVTNVTSSPTNGSFFPVGTTHVTSVAVDGSGNTATCGFDVTVMLETTNTAVVNYTIPDGSPLGIVSSMNITTPIGSITNVKVTLNITNGYNGDLYAYLVHQSGFAILLNRVGKTVSNPFGYGDPGFNVTLDDAAANGDVHDYRVTLFGNAVTPIGGPLTGVWAPDGRNVNPLTVLDTDPRTALLGSFQGLDPNGQWTLFVADLSGGYTSTLVSWGLDIEGGYAAPAITVQPQDETVQCSQPASFSVTATGLATLGYQWYFGTNGIANATNATLTLASVHFGDAGGYSVVITNGYCANVSAVTSRVAVLTVQDTNPPVISAVTATQNSANVTNCSTAVVQGQVAFSVVASGVTGSPTVTMVNGLAADAATFVNQSPAGTFNYVWNVTNTTANGTWTVTVTAADACVSTNTSFTLCVNTTQISGLVQLQSFVGTGTIPPHTRAVTFVASTNWVVGLVTNTITLWTNTLTLTNVSGDTFAYTLTGVPPNVNGLSAKTAWNLRSKVGVALDINGQASNVNFTGAKQLLGGDYTGDNLVNLSDYFVLEVNYLSTAPVADINGDGVDNLTDYFILESNWFIFGDPQ